MVKKRGKRKDNGCREVSRRLLWSLRRPSAMEERLYIGKISCVTKQRLDVRFGKVWNLARDLKGVLVNLKK